MSAAPSLSEHFAGRLDSHLATFTSDRARIVFLRSQAQTWRTRYDRFRTCQTRHGAPDPLFGQPTATDYVLTIGVIDTRLNALLAREAA